MNPDRTLSDAELTAHPDDPTIAPEMNWYTVKFRARSLDEEKTCIFTIPVSPDIHADNAPALVAATIDQLAPLLLVLSGGAWKFDPETVEIAPAYAGRGPDGLTAHIVLAAGEPEPRILGVAVTGAGLEHLRRCTAGSRFGGHDETCPPLPTEYRDCQVISRLPVDVDLRSR